LYPFRRYVAKEVTLFRKKKIFSLFIVTSLPALRLIDKMGNDETHIIHRILKGETSLYEYFLDKYSQQVFILIIRIVENQEDAEELTQDTFLKAFEHLSSFKAESSFSTWIYRIAYNTAISATRKRKQELIVMDSAMLMNISDQQIDDALNDESEERVGKLNKAIKKLDAEERALISLFYNEEKTIGEIALILGLTESNAKVKLHRIRKKLYILITEAE
jgi:RNA polymerase sigma factor (sigma-70 family)